MSEITLFRRNYSGVTKAMLREQLRNDKELDDHCWLYNIPREQAARDVVDRFLGDNPEAVHMDESGAVRAAHREEVDGLSEDDTKALRQVIDALQAFRQAHSALDEAWGLRPDHPEFEDIMSRKFPFSESFDEIAVAKWVDDAIEGLEAILKGEPA